LPFQRNIVKANNRLKTTLSLKTQNNALLNFSV